MVKVTSNGIDLDGGLEYIVPEPTQPETFYVDGASGVWKTTDGATFHETAGSPLKTNRIIVDPTKPGRLYVTVWETGNGDGLYKYDKGAWTLLRAGYAVAGVAVDPTDGDRIVISTDDDPYHDVSSATGLYLSEDGGRNLDPAEPGVSGASRFGDRFCPVESATDHPRHNGTRVLAGYGDAIEIAPAW